MDFNDYIQKLKVHRKDIADTWNEVMSLHPDNDMEEYDEALAEFFDAFRYANNETDRYYFLFEKQEPQGDFTDEEMDAYVAMMGSIGDTAQAIATWFENFSTWYWAFKEYNIDVDKLEKQTDQLVDLVLKRLDYMYDEYSEIRQLSFWED